MSKITRIGFGQVEPNHLSAQRTGQIYAQLPCAEAIEVLENGQFVKYDYANNEVNTTATDGEWMLVFNEIKLYDERKQQYKDFAMKKDEMVDGIIVPRVFKTNIGDIYTTNMIDANANVSVGTKLAPNANGILAVAGDNAEMVWKAVKIYTLADGQDAVKIQRIK